MSNVVHIPLDIPIETTENLHSGAVKCLLEREMLRYIGVGHEELVRMVYPAVRDSQWNTAQMTIEHVKADRQENAFAVQFTALFHFKKGSAPVYQMNIVIRGGEDHTITYKMEGRSLTDFMTNRIGLCVLLPIESCQGRTVKLTSPDGKIHHKSLPEMISPHQPVRNISSIEWQTATRTMVQLHFQGDVFEMEDQRNWMDHSYKVYNRPLKLPFPYEVKKGETHHQKVTLHITPDPSTEPEKNSQWKSQAPGHAGILRTGYFIPDQEILPEFMAFLHDKYTASHIRLELNMSFNWKDRLEEGIRLARKMHSGLELIIFFSPDYEQESLQLIEALKKCPDKVISLLPLHIDHKVTPGFLSNHLYDRYKDALPDLRIGYGTDLYFAELNRNRPGSQPYDFVSFSLNPQVHARDTRTLLENLQALPDIIATAISFTEKPVYISPLTIQRRAEKPPSGFLREDPDGRVNTHFAVGWYLQALYYLQGAEQVTLSIPPSSINETRDSNSPYYLLFQLLTAGPLSLEMVRSEEGVILEVVNGNDEEYTIKLDPGYLGGG